MATTLDNADREKRGYSDMPRAALTLLRRWSEGHRPGRPASRHSRSMCQMLKSYGRLQGIMRFGLLIISGRAG
jgi:hypothetical protein